MVSRLLLGSGLVLSGVSQLTFARKPFRAPVPDWMPLEKDETVTYSGVAEILLGTGSLLLKPRIHAATSMGFLTW
jgi:uncharacterized membrane protein